MIFTQYSKGPPEFIQQVARIDPCGCDTLTSVAGGYQRGSFWIVHRQLLQLTLHCFVKAGCYQLTLNHWPAASKARCYGGDSLVTAFSFLRECPRNLPARSPAVRDSVPD